MDIHQVLRQQYDAYNDLYEENLDATQDLQHTLIHDILPGLVDELGWDADKVRFARDWLEDTPVIFRTLKRHKFTSSFALVALRTTLIWRLELLPPLASDPPSPYLLCLPTLNCDPFGRPIIVIQLAKLLESTQNLQCLIIHHVELMRLHLVRLNEMRVVQQIDPVPVLQYVALLDISGMSLNGVQMIELLNWFVHELLPRFPGLLATVFVLNYSWAHAGLWNLAKRLLPSTALQKIFFPSDVELQRMLTAESLPEEWGGRLPSINSIDNQLRCYVAPASPRQIARAPPSVDYDPTLLPAPLPPHTVPSRTSLSNPFFGYPVIYDPSSSLSLRHGRRRKRDLVYTLLRLWWARWAGSTKTLLVVALIVAILTLRRKAWVPRFFLKLYRPSSRTTAALLSSFSR